MQRFLSRIADTFFSLYQLITGICSDIACPNASFIDRSDVDIIAFYSRVSAVSV